MKHIKTFEGFLNENFLSEAALPIPKMWHTITPARYKQEIEYLEWFDNFRDSLKKISDEEFWDRVKAKKAELGYIYINDFNGFDPITKKMGDSKLDGSRPPICDATQVPGRPAGKYPIISKKKIDAVNASAVIGVPIKIGKFEVAQFDLPVKMNWWEAEYSCLHLGSGWHLPNKKQMQEILAVSDEIGLAREEFYWGDASTRANEFGDFYIYGKGESGNTKIYSLGETTASHEEYRCRAVKG